MKKLLLVFLCFSIIFCCGFMKKEQKPYLIMSSGQISKQSLERIEKRFNARQRIYYVLIAPEGFKYPAIRVQISKQDDKTSNWGFSIVKTEDISVVQGDKQYNGYIYLTEKGHYILQFFYINNKRYPIIHREFMVE